MVAGVITYRTGNAAEPVERPAIIAHVVNDIGAWGAGFTRSLGFYRRAEESYRAWVREPTFGRGLILTVRVSRDLYVAHLAAQRGVRGRGNLVPLDLDALDACLAALARNVPLGASVHMPRIGCGLAGGRWEQVGPMVERHLGALPVFVYDLSGAA